MTNKKIIPGILAIIAVVAVATIAMVTNFKPAFRGIPISPSRPAAEISLRDDSGQLFKISEQRGKLVLLYFGFVNCPEECPLTMAHVKNALELLGTQASDVRVAMVSTDPVRDTPQVLRNFLDSFSPNFRGIPGTSEQLAKVWRDYGVQVLDGGETHSSFTYVIDRSGRQRLNFSPNTSAEDIAHDLKLLLAEK